MRYKPISSHVYKKNRDKFMSEMKKDSIAVFNSNDIYPIGADSTFPFEQHRDIFYLTGIDQEETILLLSPQAQEIKNREILFVKKTDKKIQIWEGPKLSKEDARLISGIEKILWLNEFDPTLGANHETTFIKLIVLFKVFNEDGPSTKELNQFLKQLKIDSKNSLVIFA